MTPHNVRNDDRREPTGERVVVANIAANDRITQVHVAALLAANSIPFQMEGSVSFDVSVKPDYVVPAAAILQHDARGRGYWMRFPNAPLSPQREQSAVSRSVLLPYPIALQAVEDRVARRVLGSAIVREHSDSYPLVVSLVILNREYLSVSRGRGRREQFRFRTGYEVDVTLGKAADMHSQMQIRVALLADGSITNR
jgi:hypothetical protein